MERPIIWLRNLLWGAGLVARQSALTLRDNWGIGILSVVLAAALWIYVTDQEDPDRTGTVGAIAIECVNVPLGKNPGSSCDETVSVRVRAPESVFDELTSADFTATADLSDVTSDEATVRVFVDSARARAEVVDVLPTDQLTVRLEDVTSRTVPVRANVVGTPPPGFEVDSVTLEPAQATVSGPESVMELVGALEVDVNLTGVRTTFEQTLLLQARDELGGNIQRVTIEPESAVVRVELAQVEFSAIFVVLPDVSGSPAVGFRVAGIEVDPPFVVISGTSEVFQTLDPSEGVGTEAVPIADARSDVTRTVALRLPEGARVAQPQVTVRVIIQPIGGGGGLETPAGGEGAGTEAPPP
jgi:YbbR domain-containing protein